MNISEAAKGTAEYIDQKFVEYYYESGGKEQMATLIQSAIDAETAEVVKRATDPIVSFHLKQVEEFREDLAAKDAEIARLQSQVDGLCHARATLNCEIDELRTAMKSDDEVICDLESENAELVEALKKAKGLFGKPDEPMQKFPNWAQAILVIDAALKKVGAE